MKNFGPNPHAQIWPNGQNIFFFCGRRGVLNRKDFGELRKNWITSENYGHISG